MVDDEDRENEGDFICAAECITPEIVNLMSKEGRSLMCAPLHRSALVRNWFGNDGCKNTSAYETPFTVSVDLIGHGCTTGISAHDRFKTIKALVDQKLKRGIREGLSAHFPIKSKEGRCFMKSWPHRSGHRFCVVGWLSRGWWLIEILNEDGSMARLPQLKK